MSESKQTDIQLIVEGRLSYAYLYKPYQNPQDPNAKPAFCTHVILDSKIKNAAGELIDNPDVIKVREAQRTIARAAWSDTLVSYTDDAGNTSQIPEWQMVLNKLAAQDKLCLHKGDISRGGVPEYAGKFYISANSSKQPTILATRNKINVAVPEGSPDSPYSGCKARVMVSIYAQSPKGKPSKWGQRVNAQLMGVQFLEHGQAFGGGRVAKLDEFGVSSTDADAPAPMAPSSDLV